MKEKNVFYSFRTISLVFLALLYFKYSLPQMEAWYTPKDGNLGMVFVIIIQAILYVIATASYLWHENAINSLEVAWSKMLFLISFAISVCLSIQFATWYWLLIPGVFETLGMLKERKLLSRKSLKQTWKEAWSIN